MEGSARRRVHKQRALRAKRTSRTCLISQASLKSFRYRTVKRAADIAIVVLLSPLLGPLFVISMIVVRLGSPGPIFYLHRRLRSDGTFFSMWKLRTMCVNSEKVLNEYLVGHPEARKEWNDTRKLRDDPRITKYGSFLRRYSLDELPQLWNVLLGQMTLVGPRPIVASEADKYGDHFECFCKAKSGITGLWQVSGRSRLTYPERVALDCMYVRSWSLRGDFAILWQTLGVVLRQDGAI